MRLVGLSVASSVLLLGAACAGPTEPAGGDPGGDPGTTGPAPSGSESPAPSSETRARCEVRSTAAYYFAGPGAEDPVGAAAMVERERELFLRSTDGRRAEVDAVDPRTGVLERVYQVSESDGVWYPDGYVTCAG